jgi:hypothetical protein
MGEAEFGKIADIAAGVERFEDEIVVTAGSEARAGAIELEAARVSDECSGVGAGVCVANGEAGADRRKVRPRRTGSSASKLGGRAEIAEGEQAMKLRGPRRRGRFPFWHHRTARGSECGGFGEASCDRYEVVGREHIVVVDKDEHFAAGRADAREARRREADQGLEQYIRGERGEEW